MTPYLLCLFLGAIFALTLGRFVIAAFRWLIAAAAFIIVGRLILLADSAIGENAGAIVYGAVAGLVVILVGSNFIYNAFVNSRRSSAHERVDKEHDGYLR